ncbi:MAG: NnrS family protein [Myxococcales bacterium]|nr:NnrS family protein [Myxococcales bacterium]
MSTTRLPVAGSTTEPERAASPPRTVLFGWGFRPFFLAAGIYAFAPLLVWLFEFSTGTDLTARWSAMFFHGHEMVFGFAAAAVTGFLLTAVPNWTGTDRVHGPKLAALAALWLAGRVAMWCSAWLPAWLVTVVDLALFPTLALTLAGPLIRAKRARNMPFPVLLLVLFAANLLTHLQVLGVAHTMRLGLHLGIYVLVMLILIVGGRITPAFTSGALRKAGSGLELRPAFRYEPVATIGAAALALVLDLAKAPAAWTASVSLLAGLLVAWRLFRWRSVRTWRWPIVWILHIGYGFVALGFLTRAVDGFFGVMTATTTLHAFTAGAIGTMILAVMTRAALGHSGRTIVASPPIVIAYLLVVAGALVRVFTPELVAPAKYPQAVVIGGVIWAAGYLLFTVIYAPILIRPRVDGRPG